MSKFFQIAILVMVHGLAVAQTKTTQALDEKYDGLTLYFYKNTLRMLNQTENKEFDEMIKDIEKMKFVMINKESDKFTQADYNKLTTGYKSEQYEELMTSRFDGKNFDVLLRESDGRVKGTIVLARDSANLYVLDILGRVQPDKVGALFKTINESTDIGEKIKEFVGDGDKKQKKSDKEDH